MFWRKWFTIGSSSVLALLLSACDTTQQWFSGTSSASSGAKTNRYVSHRHGLTKYSDNAATQDYFRANATLIENSHNNLWVAIRNDFKLPHYANSPQVQTQIVWFMHNQGYLDRTARRAAPFMYYIYQQVKARNLPSELVLLPIIESAYNPFVSNPSGATGLWEIMPGTGHSFGLRQNWWYDGRRDIAASTNAALDYFSYLQNYFGGNWLLAIAAYDTGEGNVTASIRHNTRLGLPTDYWSLPLAAETRTYIPKLLALAAIVENPQKYGIHLPPINNAPYLGDVEISSQITLAQAANLAGITLTELKTLNPGYRRSTLDPNQPYHLLLPLDKITFFKQNLLHLSNNANNADGLWAHYKIQQGDTWKKIAKRFNTSITLIQEVNHLQTKIPPVGKILLLPENAANEGAIATATTETTTPPTTALAPTDETVTSLLQNAAQQTSPTSTDTVNASNSNPDTTENNDNNNDDDVAIEKPDLSDAAHLDSPAMAMVARQNAKSEASHHHGLILYKIIHYVKRGESLASIAHSHHVATEEVAHWNHLSKHMSLHKGQKIIIWSRNAPLHSSSTNITYTPHDHHVAKNNKHKSRVNSANITHYKVRSGDTLASIAHKYHLSTKQLIAWNHLFKHPSLHAGQHLIIYTR